jgi:predicted ATPase
LEPQGQASMTEETHAFGALLRRFRTLAGLTQSELAERSSLSVRGISDLERGVNTHPRSYTVRQLADALRLSADDRQALVRASYCPRLASSAQWPNYLPYELTPLIGRERQIEAVRDLLCQSQIRLVTLTGSGGVGKTRLAMAVAASLRTHFHDGVVFVELQTISDPDLVPSAVAAALGVRESGDRALADTLVTFLRERQLLLILDNFEQILPAASLINRLLAACPRLAMLVTSRSVLHLYGEHAYLVPPFDLPDLQRLPPLDQLSQIEAIRLFTERARAARMDFALTPANAFTIAAICSAVDGLPLAIELAAARVRMLSPQALLPRLARRLRVLTDGPSDLPARQQTMREAIAWSHDLLSCAEQRLFHQLSVFVGGWTLEAAEAVCDQNLEIFGGIATLIDHSLICPVECSDSTTRFMMLETIREFGLEQLKASGAYHDIAQRHATYFVELIERAACGWWGLGDVAWPERIEPEIDNVRAVWTWLESQGDRAASLSGRVLRSQREMSRFWSANGRIREGQQRIQGLLEAGSPLPLERASALNALGLLATELNDMDGARRLHHEALAIARTEVDCLEEIQALWGLARAASWYGDEWEAISVNEQALMIAREAGNASFLYRILINLGASWSVVGSTDRAVALTTEALQVARDADSTWGVARALRNLADIALRIQGDLAAASEMQRQSLALYAEHQGQRQTRFMVETIEEFARIALAGGAEARAARLFGAAAALRDAIGIPVMSSYLAHHEQTMAQARQLLGDERWERAWNTGCTMSVDQVIAYALDQAQLEVSVA